MQSNARGHRAAFISAMRPNKKRARLADRTYYSSGRPKSKRKSDAGSSDQIRRGKRLAAYKSALKRNGTKAGAARSALRAVPFTANERKRKTSFAGVKARKKYRRNDFAGVGPGRDRLGQSAWGGSAGEQRQPTRAQQKKKRKGVKRKQYQPTRAQYQPPPKKRKTKRKGNKVAKAKRKTKAKKRRTSGEFRTVKSSVKRKTRVAYGKYKRARLYNPRTGRTEYSYMYRSGGKLRRIPTAAVIGGGKGLKGFDPKRAQKVKTARERAAARILKSGDAFIPNKKRRTKKRKSAGRKSAKRVAAGKKAARTRKRKGGGKKRRKSSAKRRGGAKASRKSRKSGKRRSGARRLRKGTYYVANRRRSKGSRMRKNAFMANLKNVLITGTLVAVGYMGHRVLTSLACEYVFTPYVTAPEGKEPSLMLKTWEKPICGGIVGLVGVGALSFMADKKVMSGETAMKLGGGMVASLVQYVVVSALTQFKQPAAAAYLSGYSNSTAYGLRGTRRGMSGMQSIMPRYQQLGAFQQAAAGMGEFFAYPGAGAFEQAAAGMGEYFTGAGAFEQAAAGVGEYFVPGGTKGVGQYEAAGPLAMQAAANGIGQIDDGIRPDSNLDRVLDLAESAAGLGEYITATPDNGGWAEGTVPTQSQWIPNGPLWAGTLAVQGTKETSMLPAGTLATVGGNGILSG